MRGSQRVSLEAVVVMHRLEVLSIISQIFWLKLSRSSHTVTHEEDSLQIRRYLKIHMQPLCHSGADSQARQEQLEAAPALLTPAYLLRMCSDVAAPTSCRSRVHSGEFHGQQSRYARSTNICTRLSRGLSMQLWSRSAALAPGQFPRPSLLDWNLVESFN